MRLTGKANARHQSPPHTNTNQPHTGRDSQDEEDWCVCVGEYPDYFLFKQRTRGGPSDDDEEEPSTRMAATAAAAGAAMMMMVAVATWMKNKSGDNHISHTHHRQPFSLLVFVRSGSLGFTLLHSHLRRCTHDTTSLLTHTPSHAALCSMARHLCVGVCVFIVFQLKLDNLSGSVERCSRSRRVHVSLFMLAVPSELICG